MRFTVCLCDHRMEIADEEKKEVVPADGVVAESVPEAPTETLVPLRNALAVGFFPNRKQVNWK